MPGHRTTRKIISTVIAFALIIASARLIAVPVSTDQEAPFYIDLNSLPAYVKSGFDIDKLPEIDEPIGDDFLVIEPARNRPIVVGRIDLPDIPKRQFPETRSLPAQDFTFLWRFTVTDQELISMRNPVLLLADVGEGWQVFVNQQLLNESIKEYPTSRRMLRVAINPLFLKSGLNQLVIRIHGDPLSPETGLYYKAPYTIEEADRVEKQVDQTLNIILITIYASIGIFHLLFIPGDPRRRFGFHFGVLSLVLATYIFSRSSYPYLLTDHITFIFRIEMASLSLGLPSFVNFIRSLLPFHSKNFKLFAVTTNFHGFLFSGLSFIVTPNLLYDLLVTWQYSAPILLIMLEMFVAAFFLKDVRRFVKSDGIFAGLYHATIQRIPGNLMLGTIFVAVTSLYDIYAALKLHTSPSMSSYGLLIFLTGSTLRIAYDLLHLLKANQRLNSLQRQNLANLKRLHRTLIRSEEKYRRLIEETNDIVFTLDSTGIVQATNSSLYRELGIRPDEIIGQPLTSLFEKEMVGVAAISQTSTINRVNDFYQSGDILRIRVPLFALHRGSHRFYDLKFEKIRSKDEADIIAQASIVEKDPALSFLVRESAIFDMHNDIAAIEDMLRRLIADLPQFLDEYDISMIRIGLREIIVNAIEHGNLGISYSEKSELLEKNKYDTEVKNRLLKEENQKKRVRISHTLTPNHIRYRITDEGDGFDHRQFGTRTKIEANEEALHGRGIFITRNAFSEVLYNSKGNSVLLLRHFSDKRPESL